MKKFFDSETRVHIFLAREILDAAINFVDGVV